MITLEQARGWYQDADPIHDFDHILRVYRMAERLAKAEGADLEIVHAAALLHDADGTQPGSEERANHHLRSAIFAEKILKEEGWDPAKIAAVQHCIRAHRYRANEEKPETIEAKVIFDADKLDVLGAIGVARVVGYAALAHQPVYALPSEQFLTSGIKEPGEPHSAYHEYCFKLRKIKDRLFTETAKKIAQERDRYLEGFFSLLAEEVEGRK